MGTLVNIIAIIVGSVIGITAKKLLKPTLQDAIMKVLGLCVLTIGIMGAIITKEMILVISSLVLGTIIGEFIDIDGHLNSFAETLQNKYFKDKGDFAQGFVISSCLYVIGAMAIIGSLQSGFGNHETLYAKSVLDGISAVFLSAVYGIGVMFSTIPVTIYQGLITLGAFFLADLLTPELINEMTAVGSIMIMAIGFNMLKLLKIKIANILPAILILPLLMQVVVPLISRLF